MRRLHLFVFMALALAGIALIFSSPEEADALLYKSKYCGCCEGYASYLRSRGVSVRVEVADMDSIKERYGISNALRSCHTVVIGGKIVEGHVPFEAVEKLMESNERGIALPGMPSGSPGMSGPKSGEFTIYALSGEVFERI